MVEHSSISPITLSFFSSSSSYYYVDILSWEDMLLELMGDDGRISDIWFEAGVLSGGMLMRDCGCVRGNVEGIGFLRSLFP